MRNYKEKPFKLEGLHKIILCNTTNMFRDKSYYLGNEKQAHSSTPNSYTSTLPQWRRWWKKGSTYSILHNLRKIIQNLNYFSENNKNSIKEEYCFVWRRSNSTKSKIHSREWIWGRTHMDFSVKKKRKQMYGWRFDLVEATQSQTLNFSNWNQSQIEKKTKVARINMKSKSQAWEEVLK